MSSIVDSQQEQYAFAERPIQFGFFAIFKVLRRNWIWLTLAMLLGLGAAYLALQVIQPKYAARSTIILAKVETRINPTETTIENSDTSLIHIETEIDFLRSVEFARKVASELNLISDTYFNPYLSATETPVPTDEQQFEAVLVRMLNSYTVERRGESLALDIRVRHPDAVMAAQLANTLSSTYIDDSLRDKKKAVQYSISELWDRITLLGGRLSEMEARLAELIRENELDDTTLGDELRAELNRLTSILNLARDQNASSIRINESKQRLAEVETKLEERTRAELTQSKLQRSLDADLARYQALVDRRNALETQIDFLQPDARQVTVASAPLKPATPNRPVIFALGIAGGLIVGLALVLLRELFDRRVWTGTQTMQYLGLRTIGYVPRIRYWRKRDKQELFLSRTSRQENSPYQLALRSLLTLLSNQIRKKDSMVMAVTSALANEGKTTLTFSLAVSAAQEGHRVLLIDLDIHRHGLTRMSGCEIPKETPQEIWEDQNVFDAQIVPCTRFGQINLLSFAQDSIIPRRVFNTPRGKAILRKLRASYDVILIDTAPVLAADEANRLASLADFVILIARWGRTSEDALGTAAEALRFNQIPLAGVVLNDIDMRRYSLRDYGAHRAGGYYAYNNGYIYKPPS
ncbi:AAA family ATPase (plasmid) [Roseibium aggregatum]|uniref:GumC family protein n=1 Tax=Stappiaceae TaxID=2821832 RepID=UPI00094B2193|nr:MULTISPECIES: polysaccharide biosynthesis tyrosine autokinase [Stappiaceae]NKX67827.1 AAA family ATPase [Labrenzia sp. 5N]UES59630.1 AAA family ATPase [Roseibium aggregatum]UFI06589.1 AAA family ATPase [Roseibium aggregatum]